MPDDVHRDSEPVEHLDAYLDQHQDQFIEELSEFVAIPSISSVSEYAGEVRRAADWVAGKLDEIGMEHVQVMPTNGHPVVYADWLHVDGRPTVLIYGHYDVQPPGPADEWTTPAFEPEIRDNRMYARGASDNKGGMFLTIIALEALIATAGELPVNVKVIFEGEEEMGSPNTLTFLLEQRELLACDVALNADAYQFSDREPAIWLGLRGGTALEIHVQAANRDLHSGVWGGIVENPVHALSAIIASMHDAVGRVAVDGFYDNVTEPTAEQREQIAAVPFDEDAAKADLGVAELAGGETGYTPRERGWIRPTLEVVGMAGGFTARDGIAAIIPADAYAKILCRLVAGQDPHDIADLVQRHVEHHSPPGVAVTVKQLPVMVPAVETPEAHPVNALAADVLEDLYDREPYRIRTGGGVPVVSFFDQHYGMTMIPYGFMLEDERFHAPDEFFRLSSFRRGQSAYARLLQRLGGGE